MKLSTFHKMAVTFYWCNKSSELYCPAVMCSIDTVLWYVLWGLFLVSVVTLKQYMLLIWTRLGVMLLQPYPDLIWSVVYGSSCLQTLDGFHRATDIIEVSFRTCWLFSALAYATLCLSTWHYVLIATWGHNGCMKLCKSK